MKLQEPTHASIQQETPADDVAVIADLQFLFTQRTAVEDAVSTHHYSCIHNHTITHFGAWSQLSVTTDNRMGLDQHRSPKLSFLVGPLPWRR